MCDIINDELDITIDVDNDIDRSHRLGRFVQGKNRPIIVKLVRHNMKNKIYSNKKKLKGKKNSITESLTQFRVQKLNQAREELLYFCDIVPLILSLLLLFYYFFQNIKSLILFLFFLSYKYFINNLFRNRIFRIPLSLQYAFGFFIKRWFNFNRKLIAIIRILTEIIFNLRNE